MFDHAISVLPSRVFFQESEIYRKQKILFVLVDILFVSAGENNRSKISNLSLSRLTI